jgi:hypothetical protein
MHAASTPAPVYDLQLFDAAMKATAKARADGKRALEEVDDKLSQNYRASDHEGKHTARVVLAAPCKRLNDLIAECEVLEAEARKWVERAHCLKAERDVLAACFSAEMSNIETQGDHSLRALSEDLERESDGRSVDVSRMLERVSHAEARERTAAAEAAEARAEAAASAASAADAASVNSSLRKERERLLAAHAAVLAGERAAAASGAARLRETIELRDGDISRLRQLLHDEKRQGVRTSRAMTEEMSEREASKHREVTELRAQQEEMRKEAAERLGTVTEAKVREQQRATAERERLVREERELARRAAARHAAVEQQKGSEARAMQARIAKMERMQQMALGIDPKTLSHSPTSVSDELNFHKYYDFPISIDCA